MKLVFLPVRKSKIKRTSPIAMLHSRSPVPAAGSFHHGLHTEGRNGKSRKCHLLVFIHHLKGLASSNEELPLLADMSLCG